MTKSEISSPANSDEIKYWNSGLGQKWVDFQEAMDTLLSSIRKRLLQRAAPAAGERVLDIGCGAGTTTRKMASLVGGDGLIVGVDVSNLLLDKAKSNEVGKQDTAIQYLLADAQTHPFPPGDFDLLISQLGVMFFSDPVAAFRNMSLALRDGGRLSFVSWAAMTHNPWFTIPRDAAIEQLGKPSSASPTAPGPFAFADIDRVVKIMQDAGFRDCSGDAEHVDLFFSGPVEDAGFLTSNIGPGARIVKEFNGTPDDVAEITRKATVGLQEYVVEGGLRVPAMLNFYSALK